MPLCNHHYNLHAAMAGSGNPYAALTPSRLHLLRILRDTPSLAALAARIEESGDWVERELAPLIAAHLVNERDGGYWPDFVITSTEETERIDLDAREVGDRFAAHLRRDWPQITAAYHRLTIGATYAWRDLAFFLVGDCILDIGLLDALVHDGTLMSAAPPRPSPDRPDARYYFWMIEGTHKQLGRYGQRATPLPWAGWHLLTFGEYVDGDGPNIARDREEARVRSYLAKWPDAGPAEIAARFDIPLVGESDTRNWWDVMRHYAAELVAVYRAHTPALRRLYASLAASRHVPNGFDEFFCWYDHIVYAHAIDALVAQGFLSIPASRFSAALWCESGETSGF